MGAFFIPEWERRCLARKVTELQAGKNPSLSLWRGHPRVSLYSLLTRAHSLLASYVAR